MTTPSTIVPFLDLKAQYRSIKPEIDAAIEQVLASANFILGKEVETFEREFAQYNGVKHCIGVGNGLDALRLVLEAIALGPGAEVIVPANTYIASLLAVSAVGARPVPVDCDAHTYEIDPSLIEAAITPRTRAIMPVHLTGHSADMDPILEIAERHGLFVLEDAAQAQGARYKNRMCGSMGHAAGFSFYPGKNLGAYGDAGAITTNDDALAERLRRLRNYGQRAKYVHVEKGVNTRLDTLQAAVLSVKLRHLDAWNDARAAHAERYEELLTGTGDLRFQQPQADCKHIYHLFIIETEHRDALQKHLAERGVGTIIHYPIPPHLQEAYADLNLPAGTFPVAERLAKQIVSLPMYAELTAEQIEHVADSIKTFFAKT